MMNVSAEPSAVTEAAAAYVIEMPGWRPIAKRIGTTLLSVSVLPMAVFYTTMSLFGIRTAVLATVGWYYAGMLLNVVRRRPVLSASVLGAGLLSIRAVIAFVTGSAFVYFLQPVAATLATALFFATTALAGRPALDRLAHEFCPLPADLSARLREHRFFTRLSVVWSLNNLLNAAGTVWLLTTSSLTGFIVLKSTLGPAMAATAALVSYFIFRFTVRDQNVSIRWAHHQRWAAVPTST